MKPFCISETREGESTTTKPMSARLFGCGDHLGFRRDNHSGAAFIILLLWLFVHVHASQSADSYHLISDTISCRLINPACHNLHH